MGASSGLLGFAQDDELVWEWLLGCLWWKGLRGMGGVSGVGVLRLRRSR